MYFIAYKYVRNHEEAEDIVSDTFEKILKLPRQNIKKKIIGDGIEFKVYLTIIVKNKALDKIKVKNNRKRILNDIHFLFPKKYKSNIWNNLYEEILNTAILMLPEKEQKIFKMKIEGCKREEIASAFKLSAKTVSNSISKSRSRLKEILKELS